MRAIIVGANHNRGLYIFKNSDEEYGYFELLGGTELEPGTILTGDFTAIAGETVRIADTGEEIDIFIEDYCSLQVAKAQVFR